MSRVRPSLDLEMLAAVVQSVRRHSPRQVRECREMQIAHYAQRDGLLRIIDEDRVLCRNSVDHTIWKGKGGGQRRSS